MPPLPSTFIGPAFAKFTVLKKIVERSQIKGDISSAIFVRGNPGDRDERHATSFLHRRTTMISIPNTYAGPNTPPAIVVGAVLAATVGFILLAWVVILILTKRNAAQLSPPSEASTPRHKRSRRRPPMREVVDPPEDGTVISTEADVIEVYESETDEESYEEPPARPPRQSGYRTVDPEVYREHGRGGRGRRGR